MRKRSTLGGGLDLEDLAVLSRVIESRSFAKTARAMGLTPSAVSKRVRRLEARLDVQLLARTTRRVVPTEAGAELYERGQQILAAVQEAEDAVSTLTGKPRGRLRVSAPATLGELHVAPLLPGFMALHPEIRLELALSDRRVNLLEERFDLALRVGRLADSSLRVRRVGRAAIVVVGSPAYLDRRGRPRAPDDLLGHVCLRYSLTPAEREWRFLERGRERLIPVHTPVQINDAGALRAAAEGGLGLVRVPWFCVEASVRAGRLEVVLAEHELPPVDVVAIYPPSRKLPARTRAFLDFVAPRLQRRLRGQARGAR